MSTKTTGSEVDIAKRDVALALLPPIFGRCLEPESTRYSLWAPALIGDMVYATDGKIAVRMPASSEVRAAVEAIKPRSRFPDASVVFEGWHHVDPTPHPVPDLSDAPECGQCEGAGEFEMPEQVECPRCGGDYFEPIDDLDDDEWEGDICHKCLGEGTVAAGKRLVMVTCGRCEGGGLFDDSRGSKGMLVHGKAELAYLYLMVLRDAGAELYFDATEPHRQGVRFRAAGGVEGVVMPMTRDPI